MKTLNKIGCDPELFLFDKVLDRIVPACGIVEGSKESPIMLNNGGMIQLDGTVLEFGTPPVDAEGSNFSTALKETLDIIRKQLSDNYGDRYELRCGASAAYSPEDITENHEGLIVGCSAQYVMVNKIRPTRAILESTGKLSPDAVPIGGHIHFGFADKMESRIVEDYSAMRYVRAMMSAGSSLFMQDVSCSASDIRKRVMGFPTSTPTIRIKPYGVEFRNLSSYWLAHARMADGLSKFHTAVVKSCIKDTGPAASKSWGIETCFHELRTSVALQHPKYQQTLPLAY